MPLPAPPNEREASTRADKTEPLSPSTKLTATAADQRVIEVVSMAPVGAGAGQGRSKQGGGGDDAAAPDGKNEAFGDLFVEASVTLPTGEEAAGCVARFSPPGGEPRGAFVMGERRPVGVAVHDACCVSVWVQASMRGVSGGA